MMIAMNTISTAVSEPRPITERILEEVRRAPDCELDALVLSLPDVTWQDVLLEVHRLSATGQVQLSPWGAGIYTVRVTSEPGQEQNLTATRVARGAIREVPTASLFVQTE